MRKKCPRSASSLEMGDRQNEDTSILYDNVNERTQK